MSDKTNHSLSLWPTIWRLLSVSNIYRSFRNIVSRKEFADFYARECICAQAGHRILDIGCGPGDILNSLPSVNYLGFDQNPKYIEAARKRFAGRGEFFVESVTKELVGRFTGFDLVLATGLIHHLNDAEAIELFEIASMALKPNGRFVSLDGVYTSNQSSLARYFVSRDRGRFVRTEEQYMALVRRVFPTVKSEILQGKLRIPYTHIVMTASTGPVE